MRYFLSTGESMSTPSGTEGYNTRLQLALRRGPNPMSARQLGRLLQAKDSPHRELRGASYATVRLYAEGRVDAPRIEVLQAFADVLGVRRDWLAFGEGPMTDEAEALHKEIQGHAEAAAGMIFAGIEHAADQLPPLFLSVRWSTYRPVLDMLLVHFLSRGGRSWEDLTQEEVAEAAETLGRLLTLPALVAGVKDFSSAPDEGEAYFMAMATAIRAALPYSSTPTPEAALKRLRWLSDVAELPDLDFTDSSSLDSTPEDSDA